MWCVALTEDIQMCILEVSREPCMWSLNLGKSNLGPWVSNLGKVGEQLSHTQVNGD
jgi:hypothetical protein